MSTPDPPVAADAAGLSAWVVGLSGCPPVAHATLLACRAPHHDDDAEPATWFYCEADARAGVARVRCVACATALPLLDSDEHWTYPPMHACAGCAQSIVEVVVGLSLDAETAVTWAVVAARCVECGRVEGMTDLFVPALPLADVLSSL